MSFAKLSPKRAIEILQSGDPSGVVIDLNGNTVFQMKSQEYCELVADALKTNAVCEELHLQNCGITDAGAVFLAEMLKENKTLRILDLEKNKISNEGATLIAEGLKENTGLVELRLLSAMTFGDNCLSTFIAMFDTNVTLRNIVWRLDSRKSFMLTKMITRNKDIYRRLLEGRSLDDFDPALRERIDAQPETSSLKLSKDSLISRAQSCPVINQAAVEPNVSDAENTDTEALKGRDRQKKTVPTSATIATKAATIATFVGNKPPRLSKPESQNQGVDGEDVPKENNQETVFNANREAPLASVPKVEQKKANEEPIPVPVKKNDAERVVSKTVQPSIPVISEEKKTPKPLESEEKKTPKPETKKPLQPVVEEKSPAQPIPQPTLRKRTDLQDQTNGAASASSAHNVRVKKTEEKSPLMLFIICGIIVSISVLYFGGFLRRND